MQLVIHAPVGARINRAWGLALRKRFCRSFDFELQASADDNGIVLSLGPQHSFPLEEVFGYLHSATARKVLTQALIAGVKAGSVDKAQVESILCDGKRAGPKEQGPGARGDL